MKRYKLVFILFLIFSTIESAYSQFKVGVKSGINLSKAHFDETSTSDQKKLVSFNGGVFTEINFAKTFFVRPEILYSIKGWSFNGTTISDAFKLNLHYINIPLLIGYKPIPKLSLVAGPEFGILLQTVRKSASSSSNDIDLYEKFDFGLSFGSSYSITKRLGIEIRYTHGLAPLVNQTIVLRDQNNNPIGESTYKDGANRVFQLNVLYTLWSN